MKRVCFNLFATALLSGLMVVRATETNSVPDFKEIYDLVRSHAPGMSEADLNRAVVEGLLNSLRGKVTLVTNDATMAERTNVQLVARSLLLEDDVAYIRVGGVDDGLAKEIADVLRELSA